MALICASLAIAIAGCGGGGDSTNRVEAAAGNPVAELRLEHEVTGSVSFEAHWTKRFSYTADTAEGEAGLVRIGFTNPQKVRHNVAFENADGETVAETETIGEGSTVTIAELEPGIYHYYCSVPGHREAGMEGVLTLKPPRP